MSYVRLSGLAVLSVEREIAKKLDFHNLIKEFEYPESKKISHMI